MFRYLRLPWQRAGSTSTQEGKCTAKCLQMMQFVCFSEREPDELVDYEAPFELCPYANLSCRSKTVLWAIGIVLVGLILLGLILDLGRRFRWFHGTCMMHDDNGYCVCDRNDSSPS